MPTTFPKTLVKVERATKSLANPASGLNDIVIDVVYEGYLFLEDISSNSDFDKFYPTGLQEGKRFYITWDNHKIDIKNDDIIRFNLSEIGNNRGSIDESLEDYYSITIKVPIKQGGLSILGSRHREGFCISYN